jgi:hypothetical protein
MTRIRALTVLVAALVASPAAAFEIGFDWSGLRLCTSGRPNTVDNPVFTLADVPPGTAFIRFRLKDLDAPGYNHGGGVVAYSGQGEIPRGAFRYKSPCPPNGTHVYEWTATAQSRRNGGVLATATARRSYPE